MVRMQVCDAASFSVQSFHRVLQGVPLRGRQLNLTFPSAPDPLPLTQKLKRSKITFISELVTFRITKAKAKVNFGVKYLCKHKCERSSVPITINTKAKATTYLLGGINFTLICVATVFKASKAPFLTL